MSTPTVVIHGGAGSALNGSQRKQQVRDALQKIVERLWDQLLAGAEAIDVAETGCAGLEDCEQFNAGRGSKLQRDGSIRMSAALMEGKKRSFSGVINVEKVQNPIRMAANLQTSRDRVLDGRGSERLARQMELPVFDPIVERRFERWLDKTRRHRLSDGEKDGKTPKDDTAASGTVGVVVCDKSGELAAATSTGGRGFERIGRVSDTATVAGNYATDAAAVSCTGTGEDIIDEALAARIVVRMERGEKLGEAIEDSIAGAKSRKRSLAAIGVDAQGHMAWAKTTEALLAVGKTDGQIRWAF